MEIKFEDYEQTIKDSLRKRGRVGLQIFESITLIRGVIKIPLCHSHYNDGTICLCDTFLLAVACVGDETGKVYFIALKHLLEEYDEMDFIKA